MTVLFVNPSWDRYVSKRGKRYNRYWPPLDLLSCAGLLERHGIQCTVYDQRITGDTEISVDDYDLVFVTSSTLDRWQCPNLDFELFLERIKTFPADRTYILGAHGTMDPVAVAKATGKAGVIREEPEIAVWKLARGEQKQNVRGLTYINGGKIVSNPSLTWSAGQPVSRSVGQWSVVDGQLPPLDELAIPAYHLVDIRHYGYELLGRNFALLETSRGCPHSCTYCYLGMYPKYRLKSPQRVVEEVRAVLEKTATRNIYFIDLEFAIHRRHCEAVLDALIDSGLKFRWCCQTRADSVDLELLKKMKCAGCRLVHYGVETGSSRIMGMVNKRIELSDIREAIRVTREAGLNSACFFMLGFPTETEPEIRQTINLAKELNPTYASFHITTPYPGTSMYENFQVRRNGHFIEETYHEALPLQTLKSLEREAYSQYYLRPSYLLSRFRTNPVTSIQQLRLFLDFAFFA